MSVREKECVRIGVRVGGTVRMSESRSESRGRIGVSESESKSRGERERV